MPLTESEVRKAVARDKNYKLADGAGLYLYVTRSGFKSWRLKYRFSPGKKKRLIFGRCPVLTLAKARVERDRARTDLREHRDPGLEERKRKMAAHAVAGATFERVGREWHETPRPHCSPVQSKKAIQAIERDVFPETGALPLLGNDGPIVLRMLRKLAARGRWSPPRAPPRAIDTAKRIRQHVPAVFGYGIAEGLVGTDPAATIGRALNPIAEEGKQPALRTLEAQTAADRNGRVYRWSAYQTGLTAAGADAPELVHDRQL